MVEIRTDAGPEDGAANTKLSVGKKNTPSELIILLLVQSFCLHKFHPQVFAWSTRKFHVPSGLRTTVIWCQCSCIQYLTSYVTFIPCVIYVLISSQKYGYCIKTILHFFHIYKFVLHFLMFLIKPTKLLQTTFLSIICKNRQVYFIVYALKSMVLFSIMYAIMQLLMTILIL